MNRNLIWPILKTDSTYSSKTVLCEKPANVFHFSSLSGHFIFHLQRLEKGTKFLGREKRVSKCLAKHEGILSLSAQQIGCARALIVPYKPRRGADAIPEGEG